MNNQPQALNMKTFALSLLAALLLSGALHAQTDNNFGKKAIDQFNEYYGIEAKIVEIIRRQCIFNILDLKANFDSNTSMYQRINSYIDSIRYIGSLRNTLSTPQWVKRINEGKVNTFIPVDSLFSDQLQKYFHSDWEVTTELPDSKTITLYLDNDLNLVHISELVKVTTPDTLEIPFIATGYREQAFALARYTQLRYKLLTDCYNAIQSYNKELMQKKQAKTSTQAERQEQLHLVAKTTDPQTLAKKANAFLAAKGHTVSEPKNLVYKGLQKVGTITGNFSQLKLNEDKFRKNMIVVRPTLENSRKPNLTPQTKQTILTNIKTSCDTFAPWIQHFAEAKNKIVPTDMLVVTFDTGLIGSVTACFNAALELDHVQWVDVSGKVRRNYPSIDATIEVYEGLTELYNDLNKQAQVL